MCSVAGTFVAVQRLTFDSCLCIAVQLAVYIVAVDGEAVHEIESVFVVDESVAVIVDS